MQALRVCDTLPTLLGVAPRLHVHSVFTHACNLQTPGHELITLQTRAMPLAPRGCILPCDNLLALFSPGLPVSVSDGPCLTFPAFSVTITDTPRCSLRLNTPLPGYDWAYLHSALQHFLPCAPPAHGIYRLLHGHRHGLPSATASGLMSAIAAMECWLHKTDSIMSLEQALQKLIGFGVGLTPAADDFLLGVLLIMEAMREPQRHALSTTVRSLLYRTTAVSAAMLDNACAGRYGAHLLALLTTAPAELPATLAAIASYGHSSGHDMLSGIDFALKNLIDQARGIFPQVVT